MHISNFLLPYMCKGLFIVSTQQSEVAEQPIETDSRQPAASNKSVKQMAAAINNKGKEEACTIQKDTTHRSKSASPIALKKSSLKSSHRVPASDHIACKLESSIKKRWSTETILEDADSKVTQMAAAQKRVSWNEQHFYKEIGRDTGNCSMDSDLAAKLRKQKEKLSVAADNSSLP